MIEIIENKWHKGKKKLDKIDITLKISQREYDVTFSSSLDVFKFAFGLPIEFKNKISTFNWLRKYLKTNKKECKKTIAKNKQVEELLKD